jgi:hypothetical protein
LPTKKAVESYFAKVGGELELIHRECWYEPWIEEQARARASLEHQYHDASRSGEFRNQSEPRDAAS